ncbi:MAG: hypothetical protein HKN68_11925 [Saprospiraceae bacterium]|nr:hypothetical protein [Saprospiraceae bacterium]
MRRVPNKNPDNPPNTLVNAKTEQERIAIQADKSSIADSIYKGDKIPINDPNDPYYQEEEYEVRYQLRLEYHNKCAYCERQEFKPDVEHYRPKGKVTGDQRNNHGYYWLCYEWTNLLPACTNCNSRSGKWNKFPIGSQRVISPPISNQKLEFEKCRINHNFLDSEQAKLLHPERDHPEQFLSVEWNGKLTPINDPNEMGKSTIKVCDLNRGNLIFNRKKIIDDHYENIIGTYVLFRDDIIKNVPDLISALKIQLGMIQRKVDIQFSFSLVYLNLWNNYRNFIENSLVDLSDDEKEVLLMAYNSF